MRYTITALTGAALIATGLMLGAPAHADPDDPDTTDSTTQQICGAFDMGIPPGEIPGRLGQNDGRWNYWRAQQKTRDSIVEGDCP